MSSEEAAGFWDARLRSPDCSEDDRIAHQRWQSADPANAHAFESLQQVISSLEPMTNRAEIESLRSSAKAWFDEEADTKRSGRRRIALVGTIAASLALLFFAIPNVFMPAKSLLEPTSQADASFTTVVGQRSTIPLDDGSAVVLNTDSQIDVRFGNDQRSVELLEGEAHFDVAHDADRPFVVAAGNYRVTAIGTAFDVLLDENGEITVTVSEGLVAVTRPGQAGGLENATQLAKGQQLRTARSGPAMRRTVNIPNAASWRDGRAVFNDVALSQAVLEMNRYSTTKLSIEDPSLARTRISGTFETGDQASFIEALEQYFAISSRQVSETDIRLEPGAHR